MRAESYDDTEMTAEEFERRLAAAVRVTGGGASFTGSSSVTVVDDVQFVGGRNATITRSVELAGT